VLTFALGFVTLANTVIDVGPVTSTHRPALTLSLIFHHLLLRNLNLGFWLFNGFQRLTMPTVAAITTGTVIATAVSITLLATKTFVLFFFSHSTSNVGSGQYYK